MVKRLGTILGLWGIMAGVVVAQPTPTSFKLGKTGLTATMTVPAGTTVTEESEILQSYVVQGKDPAFRFMLTLEPKEHSTFYVELVEKQKGDVITFQKWLMKESDFLFYQHSFFKQVSHTFSLNRTVGNRQINCTNDQNQAYSREVIEQAIATCRSVEIK